MNRQLMSIENPEYEVVKREWENLKSRAENLQNNEDCTTWKLDKIWSEVRCAKSKLDNTPKFIHIDR